MTGTPSWQENNARYLSASLAWLRALLERRAGEEHQSVALTVAERPPAPSPEESRSFWKRFRYVEPMPVRTTQPMLPSPPAKPAEERVQRAAAAMAAAGQSNPAPGLILPSQVLGLF